MPPECHLRSTPQSSSVHFFVSNPSPHAWHLLKWHTPFDAWFSEFIHVTLAGKPVTYEGALAKRGQPNEEDYLVIEAGEEVGITLELSEAFRLTSGQYRVELEPLYFFLNKEYLNQSPLNQESLRGEQSQAYKVYCNAVNLNIE